MTPEFARAENGRILLHSSHGWGEESKLYAINVYIALMDADPKAHAKQIAEIEQALKETRE